MKRILQAACALLLCLPLAYAQGVFDYFPPPGISYAPASGMQIGSPSGGAQGAGTLNTAALFKNGIEPLYAPVSNAQLAQMPANTIKCNNTGSPAVPIDCTQLQAQALVVVAQTGTFTGSLTGMTATCTATVAYAVNGNIATLSFPGSGGHVCTSNATTMTMTGLPGLLQPANPHTAWCQTIVGTATILTACGVNASTITFVPYTVGMTFVATTSMSYPNSGNKGVANDWMITYPLN